MDKEEIDFKFLFPNLIIFLGADKNETVFKQLSKSFNEFKYGPIYKQQCFKPQLGRRLSTCRIMQGSDDSPLCLAEGTGPLPCDAEQNAVESLLNKLCESCYVIKANPHYFKNKKIPQYALDVDPSQNHVYKVVFLRKNSLGVPFPLDVRGAIDYVESYDQLMKFIENHSKSCPKTDLFILNVLKADRTRIREVCNANGLAIQFLVGCSDMGIYVFRQMSSMLILQNLLRDGGKNVKYQLIGPRDKYGENEEKPDEKFSEGQSTEKLPSVENCDKGEITISQWIANHLVIMEVVSERNEMESTREIIWQAVRDCPDTEEFIVEKKRNNMGMILADALIDRVVVGRARGFHIEQAKKEAAENAMHNLKNYCYYIETKKSYFGSSQTLPYFLKRDNPIMETKIYRIASRNSGPPNKILQQFKSAWQEDLYFLYHFTEKERNDVASLAKIMKFQTRWIGREGYLCVYKRRKPNDVLQDLLSTRFKENEKYKLKLPPSRKHPQTENRETQPNWNNQESSYNTQATIPPANRFQGSFDLPSASNTQVNTLGHHSSSGDHTRGLQPCAPKEEASETKDGEMPSWAMKFIQSAPSKQPNKNKYSPYQQRRGNTYLTEAERRKDDVYLRYNFNEFPHEGNVQRAEKADASSSSVNIPNDNVQSHQKPIKMVRIQQEDVYLRYKFNASSVYVPPTPVDIPSGDVQRDQQPNTIVKSECGNPNQDSNCGSTLSDRLQRLLEAQKQTDEQDLTKYENQSNPPTSQYCSPFGRASFKTEVEPINSFGMGETSDSSAQNPKAQGSSTSNSSFGTISRYDECCKSEVDSPNHILERMDYSQSNTVQRRNSCDVKPSVARNDGSEMNSTKIFDMKPESTQQNSSQWGRGVGQQYDQSPGRSTGAQNSRSFSQLFDYSRPQHHTSGGFSRLPWPPRPPPPLKKNRPYRGHKLSKLEKYGK